MLGPSSAPHQQRRNSRSGPQPTVTEAIQVHLPRLTQSECASIAPILVSVGLELLSRLRPNLASSTFASVTSLIADWLEGLAAADQESLDRIRGASSSRVASGSKYFNDAYQVYPAWWGHEEALPSSLPAVATSAVELLAKWNLRGAVIESAARSIDQGSAAVDSAIGRPPSSPTRKLWRMATVPPPWAARRMVDEFVQTDPASSPDADTTGDLENMNVPSRNHDRRTRTTSRSPSAPKPTQQTNRKAQRVVSPSTGAPRHRSPSASGRRDEPPAEKGGFFFLPMDTASASTRRPVAPPNLVRRSQPNQSKSPGTRARSNSISRPQRPTATPSAPTARPTPPTKSTPAPSRAPTNARPIAPVKPPTSFTVPAVGSIFPVDSDKVQRMVTVAQSALADDFCAIFSSDDEDDTSTGGNTTESVDAVRFPSRATNLVDRKREVRSRDARMGMGKEWYKTEWAARDRAGADQGQSGAADKDDEKDAEASGGM